MNIYINKSNARKKILWSLLGLLACGGFLYWLLDDPARNTIKLSIALAIITLFLVLFLAEQIRAFYRKTPVLSMDEQGIQVFERIVNEVGKVDWAVIDSYKEIAVNQTERKMVFYGRDHELLIYGITDEKKRKKFMKASQLNNNALLWVEMSRLGGDLNEIRKYIAEKIKK